MCTHQSSRGFLFYYAKRNAGLCVKVYQAVLIGCLTSCVEFHHFKQRRSFLQVHGRHAHRSGVWEANPLRDHHMQPEVTGDRQRPAARPEAGRQAGHRGQSVPAEAGASRQGPDQGRRLWQGVDGC